MPLAQVQQKLHGIHPVGIVIEPGLLGLAKGYALPPHNALDFRMTAGKDEGQRLAWPVKGVVEDADGTEGRRVFGKEDRPVGHIGLLIEDQQGQLVVEIVLVF